jgi:hypothetical protein
MKKRFLKRIILGVCMSISLSLNTYAQESEGGSPPSFNQPIESRARLSIPTYITSEIPLERLQAEDAILDQGNYPYRFGYGFDVNIDVKETGAFQVLPDGSKLWILQVSCPGALSINFLYNQFKLPEGAQFFIYNKDKSMILGAYTKRNNTPTGKFATEIVAGDFVTLEYSEPANPEFSGDLVIGKIVHGYRGHSLLKPSVLAAGSCNVNINCPQAANWQSEKRSVARILMDGTGLCTGTLINNTAQNDKPYFLTANHCIGNKDAITNSDASGYIFYWNYESSTCSGTTGPTNQTTSGAVIRANNEASDFALLELNNKPAASLNVYYAGWSRSTVAANGIVGIHHPAGDVKKFSQDNSTLLNHEPGFWKVPSWDIGVTEGGSSGSAIFDFNKRVVGQLLGGSSGCGSTDQSDIYGKIAYSWDQGGTSAQRRLKDWLDPNNTGTLTADGKFQGTGGNNSPIISITSPANNASYGAPASITITVTASDADGSITGVSFYNGSTLLGTDPTSPYSFTWNNVAAGSYSIIARATDNLNATSSSAVVNLRVNLANAVATMYEDCDYDASGYSVSLAAGNYTQAQLLNLGIANNDISSLQVQNGYEVIVYADDNFLGTSQTFNANDACLVDNNLNDAVSSVRVRQIITNSPPSVNITSPNNGNTYNAPVSIAINAEATDADGSVMVVAFYHGTILLGKDSISPYSFSWNNVAAGSYTLTAVATDNQNAATTSSAVTIQVINTPVSIATVYKHCNYSTTGYAIGLDLGNYTQSQLVAKGIVNNDISSLKIQNGYEIILYADDNFLGTALTIRADNSCLVGNSFNDVTSSLRVRAINQNPLISITSPANNANFTAPATITINASATDADGTISSVAFYQGSILLGTDATSPFSFMWSNVAAGSYALTAVATDNSNGTTTSTNVTIVVNAPAIAATVYKHCNYSTTGYAINLGLGNYTQAQLVAKGILNNDVSSVKVISGYEIVLYADNNFLGSSVTVKNDIPCLVANNFNDVTSSAIVRAVTSSASDNFISSATNEKQLHISPNPANNTVTMEFENVQQSVMNVLVYDSYGHEVANHEIASGSQFDLSPLPAGVYVVRTIADGEVITHRLIKNNSY